MLTEQLTADVKQAMLSRDSLTVSVLRMLQSELKNAAIAKQGTLTEADELTVIRKELKKRTEAAAAYHTGGNEERAASEQAEAAVLTKYLPAAADTEAVRQFLKEQASTLGTLEPRHKGDLIRAAVSHFNGSLDGRTAADLVSELFG